MCGLLSEEKFTGEQTKAVIRYVREEYGGELEFLWEDENAIWRNPVNRKWYGLLMRVRSERLGLPGDEVREILVLRFEKGMAREFVAAKGVEGIRLAYHMNKDNWVTVVMDEGVALPEVLGLVDQSYRIVAG